MRGGTQPGLGARCVPSWDSAPTERGAAVRCHPRALCATCAVHLGHAQHVSQPNGFAKAARSRSRPTSVIPIGIVSTKYLLRLEKLNAAVINLRQEDRPVLLVTAVHRIGKGLTRLLRG
jgi:hypothetical protein